MNEKEMTERYIYEVIKRVPQGSREEIRMELQTLIEDMCTGEEVSVEQALSKLGNPAEFAKRYRDQDSYLIGPEYYDHYFWVLKIVLIGVGISATISGLVQGILNMNSWIDFFVIFFREWFVTAIEGAYSAVGIITIIFAVMEYKKVRVRLNPEADWSVKELSPNTASVKSWTPNLLPPVPDKCAIISRGDSVVSIIFMIAISALLLFAPQVFGAFRYDGTKLTSIACIFNLDKWSMMMPVFLLALFSGLADQIIRLVIGYHCKTVMYSSIICNIIQMAAAVILLKCLPLWNPNFIEQVSILTGRVISSHGDILFYWGSGLGSNLILGVICLSSLAEIGVTVYKTIKYLD